MKQGWTFQPDVGGRKISPVTQEAVRKRIVDHAGATCAGKYTRIDVRFHGALCYIDAYVEPCAEESDIALSLGESREEYIERMRNTPIHLCRLRHFDSEQWSVAFYTYSNERYEPCMFPSGEWFGTPEEAFDIGASYLE